MQSSPGCVSVRFSASRTTTDHHPPFCPGVRHISTLSSRRRGPGPAPGEGGGQGRPQDWRRPFLSLPSFLTKRRKRRPSTWSPVNCIQRGLITAACWHEGGDLAAVDSAEPGLPLSRSRAIHNKCPARPRGSQIKQRHHPACSLLHFAFVVLCVPLLQSLASSSIAQCAPYLRCR